MGKVLDAFKRNSKKIDETAKQIKNKKKGDSEIDSKRFKNRAEREGESNNYFDDYDDDRDYFDDYFDDEVAIQAAQKPESFHHFILDNKFKETERSIRGIKDVWDKKNQKWRSVRKRDHCFTDEEAEDILRLLQSLLSTDIKLGIINKEAFGMHIMSIYEQVSDLFERIAEYNYGRYRGHDLQARMKSQNLKIFLEVMERIRANYSVSIGGNENKATHESVKGQESLQSTDRDMSGNRGYS